MASGLCLVYGVYWTLILWLFCGGETDGCELSVWNERALGLFALSVPVVVLVVGWRVWRQPRGMLRAVIETVLALVLLTVLAVVAYKVIPVDPEGT